MLLLSRDSYQLTHIVTNTPANVTTEFSVADTAAEALEVDVLGVIALDVDTLEGR